MTILDRCRLVTEQNGVQNVSGVVLTLTEAADMLHTEAQLHEATGWHVDNYGQMIRCTRGDTIRWVWIRSRPVMGDTL